MELTTNADRLEIIFSHPAAQEILRALETIIYTNQIREIATTIAILF